VPAGSPVDQRRRRAELQLHHDQAVGPPIIHQYVRVEGRTERAEHDDDGGDAPHRRRSFTAACRATSATTADSKAASDIAGLAAISGCPDAGPSAPTSRSGLPSN